MKIKTLTIVAVASILFSACSKENDATPGSTDDRDRFTGSWICTEAGNPSSFTITITKRGAADTIRIENFAGYGTNEPQAWALISGNSMTIPFQSITQTSINIKGTGVLNTAGTKITMNYIADIDTIAAICLP